MGFVLSFTMDSNKENSEKDLRKCDVPKIVLQAPVTSHKPSS